MSEPTMAVTLFEDLFPIFLDSYAPGLLYLLFVFNMP